MTKEEKKDIPCAWCDRGLGQDTPAATCHKCHNVFHIVCLQQRHMHDEKCCNERRHQHDETIKEDIPYTGDGHLLQRVQKRIADRISADSMEALPRPLLNIPDTAYRLFDKKSLQNDYTLEIIQNRAGMRNMAGLPIHDEDTNFPLTAEVLFPSKRLLSLQQRDHTILRKRKVQRMRAGTPQEPHGHTLYTR